MSKGVHEEEGIPLTYNDSVEETLAKARLEREKAKERSAKIKKLIIIIAIIAAVAVVVIGVVIAIIVNSVPPTVSTVKPTMGDLDSTYASSGILESTETIQYQIPASILVDEMVCVGQAVSKGDILVLFDEEDYSRVLREYEIENEIARNSYQSQLVEFENNKKDLSTANANVSKYTGLVKTQQAEVDRLTASITDANAIRAAQIEVEIYECERKIADFQYCISNAEMLGMGKEGIEAYTRYIQSESQRIAELQHELSQLTGSVTALEQQKILTNAQKLLTDYEMELETAKAEKESLSVAVGNEYDEANIALNGELSTMRAGKSYEDIAMYNGGLKAECNGVITEVGASNGTLTVPGTTLVSVASTEGVKIRFAINKNAIYQLKEGQKATIRVMDKEYEGTVSRVNKAATADTSGVASLSAEVVIDNPDEDIFLGLDAKISILTASRKDVMMLPVEVVNADRDGDFVYVVENGIIVKKYVTVGISSDTHIEIVDGLDLNADVVSMITSNVVEGARAMAIPDMMSMMEATIEEPSEEEMSEEEPEETVTETDTEKEDN